MREREVEDTHARVIQKESGSGGEQRGTRKEPYICDEGPSQCCRDGRADKGGACPNAVDALLGLGV